MIVVVSIWWRATQVYRSYHIHKKMNVTRWYKNGSIDAFRQFCIQNKDKPISVKLTNRSEPVVGALHNYCLTSEKASGLFLLLTDSVIHPAYYGLEGIESLHIFPSEIMASRHSALRPET